MRTRPKTVKSDYRTCLISSSSMRRTLRASRRNALASFVYQPVLKWASLIRRRPSGVLAPVLLPPCILHLPFRIPAFRQAKPVRVLAPHCLVSRELLFTFSIGMDLFQAARHDGLAPVRYGDLLLDNRRLLAATKSVQHQHPRLEASHHARGGGS